MSMLESGHFDGIRTLCLVYKSDDYRKQDTDILQSGHALIGALSNQDIHFSQ